MKTERVLLAGLLCLMVGSSVALAHDDEEKERSKLKYKGIAKWELVLPGEKLTPVAGRIAIPHVGGDGFVAEIDGASLAIDTNGDGKVDEKAKGVADYITLKGTRPDGADFRYDIRLVNSNGWSWASSGAMVGKIKGESIQLIDQNNNGNYDDYGVDAMILGKSDAASFLSRIVNIGGELYELEVSASGEEVSVMPWTGETGVLDLTSEFETDGKLISAVVKSGGDVSFDLANAKDGMKVPAGTYELVSGYVTKGKESVRVRSSREFSVGVNDTQRLAWGGPIRAEFTYERQGDQITFDPNRIWFYGKAGEEYYAWVPDGKSPKFVIKDVDGRKKIAEARFGGC